MTVAATTTADWNSLPGEIVQQIANKSSTVEDLVALTCVSRYFRSSVQKDQWRPLDEVSQPPWLLLGCPAEKYSFNDERSALSMYTKKTFPMNQPKLHGIRLFGTTYGWILTLDVDGRWHLFNPLNQHRILLPLRGLDRDPMVIQRAMLIKRPPFRLDDFIVVATETSRKLSVLRPKENIWETVTVHCFGLIHDMAYYNGRVHVIDEYGSILIFSNLDGPGPLVEVEYVPRLLPDPTNYVYILESLGDLLLVAELVAECKNLNMKRIFGFNVFKFNHQTKELTAVEDLGDRSLFVGDSQSISLSSPESFNCRRNCIYFTDHLISPPALGNTDMGVFDLETRTIQPILKDVHPLPRLSASTWFIPKLS